MFPAPEPEDIIWENLTTPGEFMYLWTDTTAFGSHSLKIVGTGATSAVLIEPEGDGAGNAFAFAGGFLSLPQDPTNDTHAVRRGYLNNGFVTTTTNQTIGGTKEFTGATSVTNSLTADVLLMRDWGAGTIGKIVTIGSLGELTASVNSLADLAKTATTVTTNTTQTGLSGNKTWGGTHTFTPLVYATGGVEASSSGKFGFAGGGGITKVSGNTWITSQGTTIQFDCSSDASVDWIMSENQIYSNKTVSVGSANSLTSKTYVDNLNATTVKTTGDQSIGGTKTFTATNTVVQNCNVQQNIACASFNILGRHLQVGAFGVIVMSPSIFGTEQQPIIDDMQAKIASLEIQVAILTTRLTTAGL